MKVRMYCTHSCGYCRMALQFLEKKGAQVDKLYLDEDSALRKEMISLSGRTSVPQIFIGDQHIGGYTDLVELDMDGELDPLLAA